jgi:MFS family permease
MMGDSIEHVISYWVMFQQFHSPALAGFAVISHWVPSLFSVYAGAWADRYDCRKIIQFAQLLFMGVSAAWGVLFLTDSLQVWQAMVLLVLHGVAGMIWAPAEQLMLHDLAGRAQLASAVRLNSTIRSGGFAAGPALGSVLLVVLGPAFGIFANVLSTCRSPSGWRGRRTPGTCGRAELPIGRGYRHGRRCGFCVRCRPSRS